MAYQVYPATGVVNIAMKEFTLQSISPLNYCSQEIPRIFLGIFMRLHPFATQFFVTTHSQLKLFHDHHFSNHRLLKFPQPQISHVRHPNVRRTHATPFPYDSRGWQNYRKQLFSQ